ncbi:amidohydrolase [Sphingomonas sp. S-NIH.Pt15_0812]|uniref:amidohydrolase n=1 Tax=Sphingomonas sp. S-NIH.Pt15_0812 TaxID=1920129 RepID=UPI000F7EC166|nr:amidohydrolase [Sphingomonas sp. S-NIH.Pt15_0812]RSU45422.1 cytosine deaminase [Sphingomonas sp. S-NIH.Pt15_0812]
MRDPATTRLFRNVLCKDGRTQNLGVRTGRFVDPKELSDDTEAIDLDGLLALPAFIEGHIHLDKSFVGDGWRPHRPADDLGERLTIEKQLLARALPVQERADALLAQAHRLGTVAMRSHVDIDASLKLDHLHAVMAACEPWRGKVDVEIVAFPQAGILASPGTADLLDAAIREGASVVGGLDPSAFDGDADAHLDVVFGVAERQGVKIDIHLHEPGQQGIEQLRRVASRTKAAAMQGKVAVSHAYALGDVERDEAARTADLLADAGVAIMTNAPGNRAFPPIPLLRRAGVRVFAGNDNIRDAWWPYGDADMLGRSGFFTDAELAIALDMATTDAAAVLGREHYGMDLGDEATFVLVDADNASAAVAAPPCNRRLVQRGEIIAAPASRFETLLSSFDKSGPRL